MSRSKKSFKNLVAAFIGQGVGLIISFFARIIFIRILGTEYLGLNGLFTNILTMLSLAELGVGEAITFSLYKPLANNDEKKTAMLMQLYKRVYISIAIIILLIGISITPFLNIIISQEPNIPESIKLIYILFVLNTSLSYFFSYKRNLIIADQKRYIASIYRYVFYFLLNLVQIIFLIITKNYIIFLILQIIFTLLENMFVSAKANKMYPFLKNKNKIALDDDSKNTIIKNTKAMLMHKIGGIVVSSTDNILLSKFVSLTAVGLYSNYYLVISALNTIFGQLYNSLNASVGNLFATEDTNKSYTVFKRINFLSFWIFCFASVSLLCLFNDLITIWLGSQYLFNSYIVLVLVILFFITGMRKPVITFKESAGLFYKDRWKSVIEAIVNIVFSIILVKKIGVIGVFLGTLISSISVCVWVEPYVVFKYAFDVPFLQYIKRYIRYCFEFTIISFICYYFCSFIKFEIIISIILKALICIIVSNLIIYFIHRNDEEFIYFKKMFKKIKSNILKNIIN